MEALTSDNDGDGDDDDEDDDLQGCDSGVSIYIYCLPS